MKMNPRSLSGFPENMIDLPSDEPLTSIDWLVGEQPACSSKCTTASSPLALPPKRDSLRFRWKMSHLAWEVIGFTVRQALCKLLITENFLSTLLVHRLQKLRIWTIPGPRFLVILNQGGKSSTSSLTWWMYVSLFGVADVHPLCPGPQVSGRVRDAKATTCHQARHLRC